jgi:hypothetical protein
VRDQLTRFFHDYAAAFNRSLGASVDAQAIMAAYGDCFISAGPQGVECGRNGDEFRKVLHDMYAFYKRIGMQRMSVREIDATMIDERHMLARVHWSADYEKHDGTPVSIQFGVSYLMQRLPGKAAKILAFVAGDEMAALRQHGLITAQEL